jgi:hypothetical protein
MNLCATRHKKILNTLFIKALIFWHASCSSIDTIKTATIKKINNKNNTGWIARRLTRGVDPSTNSLWDTGGSLNASPFLMSPRIDLIPDQYQRDCQQSFCHTLC